MIDQVISHYRIMEKIGGADADSISFRHLLIKTEIAALVLSQHRD